MPSPLRVFTFGPAYGLPTVGPFGLKLVACLTMLGVPFELVEENDASKGPKRKSPWIEHEGTRLGDTELILRYVESTFGVALDRHLSPTERAQGHALRRMLEEHFHQVFEYELILHDEGWRTTMRPILARAMPAVVVSFVGPMFRRSMRKHLYERGIARHSDEEILAFGKADLDALAAALGDKPWLLGDVPAMVDASAFGLLASSIATRLPTPVCRYAQEHPALVAYVERAKERFVPARLRTAASITAGS
jgi:glutathione S-transferase